MDYVIKNYKNLYIKLNANGKAETCSDKDKDLFGGWKLYKQIRDNRKQRRDLKDEILIVKNVLREITDDSCFQRKRIKRAIDGLFTRKYAFRVVEEENR